MSDKVGSFNLKFSGNLLTFSRKGPWDEAAVLRYQGNIQAAIDFFAGKQWGFLSYLTDEAILTLEAEDYMKNITKLHATQGMQACAIVLSDTIYPAIIRAQAERIYNHAGVSYRFFESDKEALSWMNKLGFF